MILKKRKYLTDITSSEGNLKRFSTICKKFYSVRTISKTKAQLLVKETGINHPKVIGRYLHILKVLNFITTKGEFYVLTSFGKVLAENNTLKDLSSEEKTIFFMSFFKKIPDQLYFVLKSINDLDPIRDYNISFEKSVINYFSSSSVQKIWNKKTIENSIIKYNKTGKLQRGIENKFETMVSWLFQMDLIKRFPTLKLTPKGLRVIQELHKNIDDFDLFTLVATYYSPNFEKLSPNQENQDLLPLIEKALGKFSNKEGFSDLTSVKLYCFVAALVEHKVFLDEKSVFRLLENMKKRGKIKSFLLDRKGKLALAQLSLVS